MPSSTWIFLIVIAVLLAAWYFWSKYGAMYSAIQAHPDAVKAGMSVARYATDIEGLVGAYETADNTEGGFMSRLGAFFGALPT